MSGTVYWFKVPIIGMPGWPTCAVPVTLDGRLLDGDGEPLPIEERTRPCGQDTVWMAGELCLCREHFPTIADELDEEGHEAVERAYKEALA